MSLQFVFGNSGSGKSNYIFEKITKEANANRDKNYLVIVPEQFTMQTQRELVDYSPNKAIMNIDVLSFNRLAYRIFDELGVKTDEILEETGKNLVIRKIAQENSKELKILGSNMNKMGYINEVKSLLSEFMQYNIRPEQIKNMLDSRMFSPMLESKLRDVLVMYEGFESFMKDKYITAEEILNVLKMVVADSKILKNSVIVFDEFTGFTPIQNLLMQELFKVTDKIIVSLTIDSREDFFHSRGMHELFDMPKKTIKALYDMATRLGVEVLEPIVLSDVEKKRFKDSPEMAFLEQNLFRRSGKQFDREIENIVINNVKTTNEELILVARQINELVQNKGYRYKDIAVVTGEVSNYYNYIETVMGRYNIPYFVDTTKDIIFHPFIEFLKSILEIIHKNFSRESIIRFLRCGFCDLEENQIDTIDNYLLAVGLRGYSAWNKIWARRPKQKGYDIEELNKNREHIMELLGPVYEVFANKESTVKDQIFAIYQLIVTLKIQEKLRDKENYYSDQGDEVKAKEYNQIYRIVMNLFDKYVVLLGEDKISTKEFIEILEAGFDAAEVATIPPGCDDVTIGDIERTRLNHVKVLFFIGVNDGVIPKKASSGGIISQYERESLREQNVELAPGAREQSFIQRFYLYLNMTKPSDRLYISFANVGTDGKSVRPSYLIETIKGLFPSIKIKCHEDIKKTMNVSTVESATEYLVYGDRDEKWYSLAKYFKESDAYRNRVEDLIEASFVKYVDEPISRNVARAIYGDEVKGSVTRLEQFAKCQYAHFLKYGLNLKEREEASFANVDIGILYHDALERYSTKLEASSYDWFNVPEIEREELASNALSEAVMSYPNFTACATAETIHLIERMEAVFQQTVWALTTQVRAGEFVPKEFEVEFEDKFDQNIMLNGRIDRMDICSSTRGDLVKVIDYKTGSKTFKLLDLYHGLQLQLAVYLKEALTSENRIPAAMFYFKIDDPEITVTDDDTEESIKMKILKELKPDGLLNSSEDVYTALDTDIDSASVVIPFGLKKDGDISAKSKVATEEQLRTIADYSTSKINELGKEILAGEISINPIKEKDNDVCSYCSYKSICMVESKIPGMEYKKLEKYEDEDLYGRMATFNALDRARDNKTAKISEKTDDSTNYKLGEEADHE